MGSLASLDRLFYSELHLTRVRARGEPSVPGPGNGSWRWIRRLLLAYSPANHHQHHGRTHPASIRPVRVRIGRLVVGNRHLEWQLATPPSPLGLAVGLACVLCRPSNHARWLAERRELGGFGAPCLGSLIGVWAVIPWQLQGRPGPS